MIECLVKTNAMYSFREPFITLAKLICEYLPLCLLIVDFPHTGGGFINFRNGGFGLEVKYFYRGCSCSNRKHKVHTINLVFITSQGLSTS